MTRVEASVLRNITGEDAYQRRKSDWRLLIQLVVTFESRHYRCDQNILCVLTTVVKF